MPAHTMIHSLCNISFFLSPRGWTHADVAEGPGCTLRPLWGRWVLTLFQPSHPQVTPPAHQNNRRMAPDSLLNWGCALPASRFPVFLQLHTRFRIHPALDLEVAGVLTNLRKWGVKFNKSGRPGEIRVQAPGPGSMHLAVCSALATAALAEYYQ